MSIKQTKTEQRLRSVIQQEIANGENSDQSETYQNRQDALDYYDGKKPAPHDASSDADFIVSTDVADMTNAVLAQLTPMLSTDALVTFESDGKEDEQRARAESNAVNNVIIERNQGFIELEEAIKDALLMRNACCKVYVEDDVDVRYVSTQLGDEPLPPEQIAALLQPQLPNEERELSGDRVKITTTERHFRFDAVPIDNIIYEANASKSDVQALRFFAERLYYTRSDLVEMGHPKEVVDQLRYVTDSQQLVERKRNASNQTANLAHTPDQQVVECYEVYLRFDVDGDGVSERLRILYAGGSGGYVLEYEEVDVTPYALGTGFIKSHRIQGESMFDHLKQTQVYKTELLRHWMDNIGYISGGRWTVDPMAVDMRDFMNGGKIIKTKDPNRPPIRIDENDIGASILNALTYQDKMRTERGGAALDMMSSDAQLVGETAYGIERQYGQRELLVSFMSRNLAETLIRPIYLLMHHMMRSYANAPISLKFNGDWVEVDPSQWPQRVRCNVKAGMSAGERTHIQRTLTQLLQIQMQAIGQGMNGVLADVNTVYNTIHDWAVMAGLDEPDSYSINPNSQAAKQAAQQNQQSQQAQQQAQQQIQQAIYQLEMQKLQQAAKEAQDELAYKYWSDRLQAETKEAEIVAKGITDLEKVQLEGQARERIALNGAARSTADTETDRGRT